MIGKVLKIGIAKTKGSLIEALESAEAIKNEGLFNDRKLKKNNNNKSQLTLIEIENITYFNKLNEKAVDPLDFRRNIVTENIRLNKLIGTEFFIGDIKVIGRDLCRPCKYLQQKLKKNNFIKELLLKGGLRCEILTSGKIYLNDIITFKND